jgi:hypothetical protein
MNVENAIKGMQFLQAAYEKKIEQVVGEPDSRYERYVNLQAACSAAEQALLKQLPRTVIPHGTMAGLCYCPGCRTEVYMEHGDKNFCPGCGQALERRGPDVAVQT